MSRKDFEKLPKRRSTKILSRIWNTPLIDLPLLSSFKTDDFERVKREAYSTLSLFREEDKVFTKLKVPIKKKYIKKLENDFEMHHNVFLFTLRYLIALQNSQETPGIYVLALEVLDFVDPMALKYEFLPGLENIHKKVADLQIYNYLLYVVKVNSRWIIEIVNLKTKKAWLIDFINPALSHLKPNMIHFLIDRIHSQLFKDHLPEDFEILEKFIVRDLSDYALYASFLVFLLISQKKPAPENEDFKQFVEDVDEDLMKSFQEKVLWLIYSIITTTYPRKETDFEPHKKIDLPSKPHLSQRNAIARAESIPFKDTERISLSSRMLKDLLKQTKEEILEEVSGKRSVSNIEKFIEEEFESKTTRFPKLDEKHLKITKDDLKDILTKYKQRFRKIRMDQVTEEQDKSTQLMQNYSNFSYLLWYYYNYDPETYNKLLGLPPTIPEEAKEEPKNEFPQFKPEPEKSKRAYIPQYNVSINDITGFREEHNPEKSINLNNNSSQLSKTQRKLKQRSGEGSEFMGVAKTEPDENMDKMHGGAFPSLKSILSQKIPSSSNTLTHRKSKSYQIKPISGITHLQPDDPKNNKSSLIPSAHHIPQNPSLVLPSNDSRRGSYVVGTPYTREFEHKSAAIPSFKHLTPLISGNDTKLPKINEKTPYILRGNH